jgi:hypothetical protein
MAPITFTPEEGKAALEAAYQGARDDNWDGAGFKLDFIHLVIEPRQQAPSAATYGKHF